MLIVPPVLLAVVEYIAVGRLLAMSAAGRASRLSKWVTRAFTASDVLCLLIQGGGGGLAGSGDDRLRTMGSRVMLVGLALQLGFFSAFTAVTVHVQREPRFGFAGARRVRPLFAAIYATVALMFLRNIFRVVEFGLGYTGYLATHEVFFYCFDLAPILSCFVIFTLFHYGLYLPVAAEVAAAADAARNGAAAAEAGGGKGAAGKGAGGVGGAARAGASVPEVLNVVCG
jgi:hypothetical protein